MISEIAPNIKNPTMISAGAVANDGIAVKSGANNVEIRNKNPETTAVKPVRPPAATPEEDSTNVVTVEVPRTAPAVVATASAINAGLIPGSLPSSSSIPAFVLTPTKVPSVSNRSTNKKDNTTAIKLKIPTLPKSYWKHLPKVSPNFGKSDKNKRKPSGV